jgi:hypothetical protein
VIARTAASVVVAAGVVLGATGCSFFATQATLIKYEPSDGVSADLGDVAVRNAVVLSEDGETATLVATVINDGDSAATVNVQYTDADGEKVTSQIRADAESVTPVGYGAGDPILLENLDVTVGSLIPLYFQFGDDPGDGVLAPVLDGDQEQWSTLVPTATPETSE